MILTHVCRTIAIAGHTGDIDTVLDGLNHESPEVRVVALGAAHRLDALTVDTLGPFLDDQSPAVRYRAVELVARAAFGAQLGERLIGSLADPELSEVAAFALGELDLDPGVRSRAADALGAQSSQHDDALSRESAVAALGALEVGVEHILAATGDVATVRRRAVLALAPFDGPDVTAALERALEDRDWQVRQAAEDLLE